MEKIEGISEHNGTGEEFHYRDPLYILIPITILYCLILLTGVVGNVITCVVIARNRHMHTATNYYLFSLAVSDLLLLVSGLPQEMYNMYSYPYVFGEAFCLLRGLAAETSANASVLTITAFTVERYVAICHPLLAHTMSKLSRAFRAILLIWVVALTFAIPQALQYGVVGSSPDLRMCALKRVLLEHSFAISTILFFIAPMSIITFLYALIGLQLRRSALLKRSPSFSNHQENRKESGPNNSSQRVLKMLVAVVVAFFICWAPFHAQRFFTRYEVFINAKKGRSPFTDKLYAVVLYSSGILYYVSTTVNPILYHIMSAKFREAFKETLASCCCNKDRCHWYSILSKRQRVEIRDPREEALESGKESWDSGAREEHTEKYGHSSKSTYIVNQISQ